LRIEGVGLTKADVGEVLKRMFAVESRIISLDLQTAYATVVVHDYHSSHIIETEGGRS
jgi:hypothetical protein